MTTPDFETAIAGNAETCVAFFRDELGAPPLDFSRASLQIVDDFLGAMHTMGQQPPAHILGLIDAYVYDTARREFGGFYLEGNAENPYVLGIPAPDPRVIAFVQQKVRGRLANGAEDSIPFFYDGIAGQLATEGVSWLT